MALVVAHPDDETIGAGAAMPLLRDLLLVHVTDGAPRNGFDATAYGFASPGDYAAARQAELGAALQCAGVDPRRVGLGVADQGASLALDALIAALRPLLANLAAVFTHPYEGGHPDHDAVAFAVHRAASCPVFEFAGYHAGGVGQFLPPQDAVMPGPDPGIHGAPTAKGHPAGIDDRPVGGAGECGTPWIPGSSPGMTDMVGAVLHLTAGEAARKRAMLDAFTTQRATLAPFGVEREPFRSAPAYDFTHPPHPGALHYERYDWGMTGVRWRSLAACALS